MKAAEPSWCAAIRLPPSSYRRKGPRFTHLAPLISCLPLGRQASTLPGGVLWSLSRCLGRRSTILIGVFLLHLEVLGEARNYMCVANGLGHMTVMKGRSKHAQDRFLSTLHVATWSRRQAGNQSRCERLGSDKLLLWPLR